LERYGGRRNYWEIRGEGNREGAHILLAADGCVQFCVFRVYCVRSSLSVHSGQVKTGWREQAIACRPPCRAAMVADYPAGLSNQP